MKFRKQWYKVMASSFFESFMSKAMILAYDKIPLLWNKNEKIKLKQHYHIDVFFLESDYKHIFQIHQFIGGRQRKIPRYEINYRF